MRTIRLLAGLTLLIVPEVLRVYFIMPFPGSQENVATDLRQVEIAFWLHHHVWWLRLFGLALVAGPALHHLRTGGWMKRTAVLLALLVAASVYHLFNFKLMADRMFLPMERKVMAPAAQDSGGPNDLVIAVERNGQARAYPIELIGYHHQVLDTIGGEVVMVTYCTVCRTGRVFSPRIGDEAQDFRLVGMDHFNAMLEDVRTGSWWRQANGEAVVGPRKGTLLREIPSRQVTLKQWLALYPHSRILQPDSVFTEEYAKDYAYERGTSRKKLTGTDTSSWADKSWVVGLTVGGQSRAYDWNALERTKVINDVLNGTPVVLALASDSLSFYAFERPDTATVFRVENDSLVTGNGPAVRAFAFNGKGASGALVPLVASQEFWHSWQSFHPRTTRYP